LRGKAVQDGFPVLFAFHEDKGDAQRELHLGRISLDRLAVLEEDLLLAVQLLHRPAEPVTDVSMLSEQAQRPALTCSADQDFRTSGLNRTRDVQRAVDPVVLAFE